MEDKRGSSRVPVYSGENFDDWKFLMMNVLRDEGCLEVAVTPLSTLIEQIDLGAPGDSAAARKRKEESIAALEVKENRCRRLLGEALPGHLELLKDKQNAGEMWSGILESSERKSLSSRAVLSREYRNIKYRPAEEEFSAYCLKFDRLVRALRNTGLVMKEHDVACEFMWTLPTEY